MTSFPLSDRGCDDTHRDDGVPVGPARGKAGNLAGPLRSLPTIGSPRVDFHHGQEQLRSITGRRYVCSLTLTPQCTRSLDGSGPIRRRAIEADGPDGPVDSLRSGPRGQRAHKALGKPSASHRSLDALRSQPRGSRVHSSHSLFSLSIGRERRERLSKKGGAEQAA